MITAEMQDTANDRAVKKKTSIIFRIAVAISPIRGGITGKRIDYFERRQAGDHGDQRAGWDSAHFILMYLRHGSKPQHGTIKKTAVCIKG
jgi:hypothetical protein